MSEPEFLGPFVPEEKSRDYLSHMNEGKTLAFENSSRFDEKAADWLQTVGMEDKYVVTRGKDGRWVGFLILQPKSREQPKRGFSEEYLKGDQLAQKKSKYARK
jgi:hypothetical protein